MKISARKSCACAALLVFSIILLIKMLFFNETPEEVVLSPNKSIRRNVIDEIDISIYQREPHLSQQEILDKIGSRNASEVVSPNVVTTYIQPTKVYFIKEILDPKLSILILVTSVPAARKQRNSIRNTWAKWAAEMSNKYLIRIFFFTGLPKSNSSLDVEKLQEESSQHNDLIVDDFTENYYSLTPKTLRMLKWYTQTFHVSKNSGISTHAPDFLIKTDHDVFINIPNLGSFLSSILAKASDSSVSSSSSSSSSSEEDYTETNVSSSLKSNSSSSEEEEVGLSLPSWYFIGGHVYYNPPLDNRNHSKFYISPEFWFGKNVSHYPSYAAGPMYILSGNIVPILYQRSFSVPLFPFEDTYLLGLVAGVSLNLTITDVPGIEPMLQNTHKIIQNKFKLRKVIGLHPIEPPKRMYTVFTTVHDIMMTSTGILLKKSDNANDKYSENVSEQV